MEEPLIREIAKKHGKTPAQVLIKYQIQHGNVAISKSVTLSRIEENFNSFDFDLSAEEMKEIEGLNQNRRTNLELR
jgi:diketogulonate reductase-like aldo/keto reductase